MKIIRALGRWFTSDLKESGKPPSRYTKISSSVIVQTVKENIELRRGTSGTIFIWKHLGGGRGEYLEGMTIEDMRNLRDIIDESLENVEEVERGE